MIGTQLKSAFAQRHSTQVQKCELRNLEREIWAKERKTEKLQSAEAGTKQTRSCPRLLARKASRHFFTYLIN